METNFNNINEVLKTVLKLYNETWSDNSKWEQNLDLAQIYLEKLTSDNPKNTIILTNLGAILTDKGKPKEAIKYLLKAEKLGSTDSNLYKNIAIAKMNIEEERKNAKIYFEKATSFKPNELTIEAYFDPQAH